MTRANQSIAEFGPIFEALGLLSTKDPDEMKANMAKLHDNNPAAAEQREALRKAIAFKAYEFNCHGVETNENGEYWFRSAKPRWHPIPGDGPVGDMLKAMGRAAIRAAHIHFIVRAAGYEDVVTHVFPPDCPHLGSDAVFGVKESLIGDFKLSDDKAEAERLGFKPPFWSLQWDFALARKTAKTPRGA